MTIETFATVVAIATAFGGILIWAVRHEIRSATEPIQTQLTRMDTEAKGTTADHGRRIEALEATDREHTEAISTMRVEVAGLRGEVKSR